MEIFDENGLKNQSSIVNQDHQFHDQCELDKKSSDALDRQDHMGQFLQDGENGCFVSYFFEK